MEKSTGSGTQVGRQGSPQQNSSLYSSPSPSAPLGDPSDRTIQALFREIAALKEVIFTRLEGMDRAIVLFNENMTSVPTDTDKQIMHLKELVMERFAVDAERFSTIQMQFKERDVRVEQNSRESKIAVDAALQAAKEAVGAAQNASGLAINKSEMATLKQIDQLGQLVQTGIKTADDKNADLKDRLNKIEGKTEGSKSSFSVLMAVIAAVGTIVAVVVSIVVVMSKSL